MLLVGLSHDLELATIAGRLGRRGSDVSVLLLDHLESQPSWVLPEADLTQSFDIAFCRAHRADQPVHYHSDKTLRYGSLWKSVAARDRNFVSEQFNTLIWATLRKFEVGRWINAPWAVRDAENKLVQLTAAIEAGFATPRTLVSSHAGEVRAFAAQSARGVVVKSLDSPLVWEDDESAGFLYTSEVDVSQVSDTGFPRLFQERVDSQEELRITVVGRQMFAARVRHEDLDDGSDWRKSAASHQAFEPTLISASVRDQLAQVMRTLGLQIGGFDLLRSGDEVVFLEVNASCAYLWLERALETHITETVIQTLLVG